MYRPLAGFHILVWGTTGSCALLSFASIAAAVVLVWVVVVSAACVGVVAALLASFLC